MTDPSGSVAAPDQFDYSDYQEAPPEDDALAPLRQLVRERADVAARAAALADELAQAQERLRDLSERLLPEAMGALRLKRFETDDGLVVEVERKPRAHIPKEDEAWRAACFGWLRANGYASVVKALASVDVTGDQVLRETLLAAALRSGVSMKVAEGVHDQTLGRIAREVYAEGRALPACFGPHVQTIAVVKKAAKK